VWTFPADLRERARSAVFEEMHRCGYFLNCGLRFGGDFNAYPGEWRR
jgi:tRNA splicing endonuclease